MIRNIYYLSPSCSVPIGGIQKFYQHVHALNKQGFKAYVLHQRPGFRYPWRKHEVPVASFLSPASWFFSQIQGKITGRYDDTWRLLTKERDLFAWMPDNRKISLPKLSGDDVLVHPEYLVPDLLDVISLFPSVILNFTAYQTYAKCSLLKTLKGMPLPYDEKILGCIVGSKDTADYLRFVYPKTPLFFCPFGVDTEFVYHAEKKRQIALMPRKCRDHLIQVINILKARNKIPGWSFVSLENVSQHQMVERMQSSAIFLSTSYMEGFGLPPAEALACGTLVVGYDGEGGREFFREPFAHAIPHGNIIGFVKKVEELVELYEKDRLRFQKIGKEASDFIRNTYTLEKENESIVNSWREIQQNYVHK